MIADAHEKPMFGASTHLIANAWTSADTFRRSLLPSLIAVYERSGFLICVTVKDGGVCGVASQP